MIIYALFKVVIASVIATSVMTVMSYAVSNYLGRQYREPVLLRYFLDSFNLSWTARSSIILSWLLHYSIGIALVTAYQMYWSFVIIENPWWNLALLAVITGLIGVGSWKVIFKMCKYKPHIDYLGYYIHIFLVHLIFTITATFTYLLL